MRRNRLSIYKYRNAAWKLKDDSRLMARQKITLSRLTVLVLVNRRMIDVLDVHGVAAKGASSRSPYYMAIKKALSCLSLREFTVQSIHPF